MKKLIILMFALVAMNGAMAQWFTQNSGTTNGLSSVFFTDENTGYAVGWDGTILKTSDGGNTWENQTSGTNNSLSSVFFTSAVIGYVVGDSGTILKTTNGGIVWEALESGTSEPLSSVHFPDTETGYVVGNGAIILKTTDGGVNWTSQYWGTQTLTWLNTVHFTDPNNGYACGGQLGGCLQQDGIILKTTNGGVEWTLSLLFGIEYGILYSLSAVDSNTVFAIGASEEGPAHTDLITTTNGGINWLAGFISGSQTRSVFFIDSQTGFVVGRESEDGDGTVLKTIDGGMTWTEQSVGISVWLNSVHFPTINIGYIVGDNGTILKTTNGGGSSGCLPEGITFTTQEQIDNFQANYPGCTEIEGDVLIKGNDITSLNGLNILTSIGGYLNLGEYGGNPALNSLTGLDNLISIGGDLKMYFNNALISLAGLENLTSIGGNFGIYSNDSLTSLTGLENLVSIGGNLNIGGHAFGNASLTSLTGLDNLISIGGNLFIRDNPELSDLTALESLTFIPGDLIIIGNDSLTDCAIQNICDCLNAPNGVVEILYNGAGCNSQSEVVNACGGSVPCLPFGNYYFLSQADVDNFQINFPACNELAGDLIISGDSITNLTGLYQVYSIGGGAFITNCDNLENLNGLENLHSVGGSFGLLYENNRIKDFSGLENLNSIGGSLRIGSLDDGGSGYPIPTGNDSLTSISSLVNLSHVGAGIEIGQNPSLSSLAGLENINASTLTGMVIILNSSLSTCEVQSICDYLASPNSNIDIWGNAPGCNSPEEVEAACEQHCLPDGINFTTQEQIDNFQTNYPGCTEIEGDVSIYMSNITNLNGLGVLNTIGGNLSIASNPSLISLTGMGGLTSIGGSFYVESNNSLINFEGLENLNYVSGDFDIGYTEYGNSSLTSLDGLNNLDSIGGRLWITSNPLLTNLTGLENLTGLGSDLWIGENYSLSSLQGLDSINASTINNLFIFGNSNLSTCEVQSVCDYLSSPNGTVNIEYNAPGCNSPEEVTEACPTLVEEVNSENGIRITPNPAIDMISVSWPMPTGTAQLTLFNITGEKLMEKQITNSETQINISTLPQGVYFVRVQGEKMSEVAKIIKD